ncbi:MAG: hypothetical protein GXP62_03995 [Oligoflexia bacterium]|nr:hypothetical protein [Oligoflexia bacterium]
MRTSWTLAIALAVATGAARAAEPSPQPSSEPSSESSSGPDPDGGELARRIDIVAGALERLAIGEAAAEADQSVNGMGPAASKVYRASRGVSLGGYGELAYLNPALTRQDGASSGAFATLDATRLVLYAGYKFDDRWVLNSEIEFEHGDELSVEFAFLDYRAAPALGARAGLLLVPMGITNEQHEPTTFASVLRPQVERVLLPTTWSELGLGVYGEAGPVSYRGYLMNGMDAMGFTAAGLRGGRQGGSEARAESFAGVLRVDIEPVSGMVVGGSGLYGGAGQGQLDPSTGDPVQVSTLVYEGHVTVDVAGLSLRGLFAGATLGDVAALDQALGLSGADSVGQALAGGYISVGYDVLGPLGVERQALEPTVRFEILDTQLAVPDGYQSSPSQARTVLTAGLAWKPQSQISIKADYQRNTNQARTGVDQIDAGLAFIF